MSKHPKSNIAIAYDEVAAVRRENLELRQQNAQIKLLFAWWLLDHGGEIRIHPRMDDVSKYDIRKITDKATGDTVYTLEEKVSYQEEPHDTGLDIPVVVQDS